MSVVLQFTTDEEAKALPILLRHSPGTVLTDRTYIVENTVVQGLTDAGVFFCQLQLPLTRSVVEDSIISMND
jgi:hypothetical protein